MEKVAEFLRHASQCLDMARKQSDEDLRDQLSEVAHQWTLLAGAREEFVRTHHSINKSPL